VTIHLNEARGLVAPLVGYPGVHLIGSSLRESITCTETHVASIRAIHERWAPDLLMPMMDLAVEAGALGLPVRFPDNESPTVTEHPVSAPSDLRAFRSIDVLGDPRLRSFVATLEQLSALEGCYLGAYVVGPFTLVGLLLGATEAAIATIRKPDLVHQAAELAVDVAQSYANACISAGAELVVLLEPTAVLLSPEAFADFSGQYISTLFASLSVPGILHICGNTTPLLPSMSATRAEGLSLDAAVDLPKAAVELPANTALIGNIHPVHVMCSDDPRIVENSVRHLAQSMGGRPGFILSTGCDLPLETPLENIDTFVRVGREATTAEGEQEATHEH